MDKKGLLCHIGYHMNWLAIDRTDWLSTEQIGYR